MRKPLLSWPVFLAAAALAGVGCTVPRAGLSGSSLGVGGEGPSTSSSAAGGSGGMDPSTGTGTGSSTGCVPTAEACDDGIDNDCDGLIDCADQDCTGPADGRACVDDPPAGWTLAAVANDPSATCPAGYDALAKVSAAPTSAASACTCSCGQAPANPCTQGTLNLQMGLMGCGASLYNPVVTGGCDALGVNVTSDYKTGKGSVLPPKALTCPATGVLPAAQAAPVSVTCLPAVSAASGCQAGAACLPKLATATLCIQKSGDVACPAGPYTQRQVVSAPGGVTDQRTCGACSCTSSAASCLNAKFTGYNDPSCSLNAVSVVVDGTCHATVNNGSFKNNDYFTYQATPDTMSCGATGPLPALSGGFVLDNPITLCCQ